MVDTIVKAIDNNKFCTGVFIDLKKAFDTVDHSLLIKKFKYYGVRGISSKFLDSYLNNRKQFVSYQDVNSTEQLIKCGVPQGSILGPLLFILYINDMCKVSKLLQFIVFADDTNIFYLDNDPFKMVKVINEELKQLTMWFKVNKLSLNVTKSNYMIFSKTNQNVPNVKLNGIILEKVNCTKFLGVLIDNNLSWNNHIQSVQTKIAKAIGAMYRIKNKVDSNILLMIYNTLILPHLAYCCEIWGNTYNTRLHCLVLLQKRAVRIIDMVGWREHSSEIFKKYKILKCNDLIAVIAYQTRFLIVKGKLRCTSRIKLKVKSMNKY